MILAPWSPGPSSLESPFQALFGKYTHTPPPYGTIFLRTEPVSAKNLLVRQKPPVAPPPPHENRHIYHTIYTTGKGTPNIRFIGAHRKLSPKHVPAFPILTNLAEISASSSKNVKTHGRIRQTGLSWPKFRPGPSRLEIRSLKWVPMTIDRSKEQRSSDISAWCAMYYTQLQANTCHLTNQYRLLQCLWRNTIIRDEKH